MLKLCFCRQCPAWVSRQLESTLSILDHSILCCFCRQAKWIENQSVLSEGHTEKHAYSVWSAPCTYREVYNGCLWTTLPHCTWAPDFNVELTFVSFSFRVCGHTFCLSAVCLHFHPELLPKFALPMHRNLSFSSFSSFNSSSFLFHPCAVLRLRQHWILPPISVGISLASVLAKATGVITGAWTLLLLPPQWHCHPCLAARELQSLHWHWHTVLPFCPALLQPSPTREDRFL